MDTLIDLLSFHDELVRYRDMIAHFSSYDGGTIQSLRSDLQRTYARLEEAMTKYGSKDHASVFESAFEPVDPLHWAEELNHLDRCINITDKAIGKLEAERDSWKVPKQTPRGKSQKPKPSTSSYGTIDTVSVSATSREAFVWDAFISHATEDKELFARPLAERLMREGVKVWYDEFTLTVGDSLRRSIDKGLARSRYGIVVLSPPFFAKDLPNKELDALVARERDGKKVILPIWLNVDRDDVANHSPLLADRKAVKVIEGMDSVVAQLLRVLKPKSSGPDHAAKRQRRERLKKGTTGLNTSQMADKLVVILVSIWEKAPAELSEPGWGVDIWVLASAASLISKEEARRRREWYISGAMDDLPLVAQYMKQRGWVTYSDQGAYGKHSKALYPTPRGIDYAHSKMRLDVGREI